MQYKPLSREHFSSMKIYNDILYKVDCKWDDIVKYDKCSVTCGQGNQKGTKSLTRAGQNGGRSCNTNPHIEMRKCILNPCFTNHTSPSAGRYYIKISN